MYETITKFNKEFPVLNFFIDMKLPRKIPAIIEGRNVHINKNQSIKKLKTVLIEEVMHWKYTVGDITDQEIMENIKQEKFARRKSYEYLVPFDTLLHCYDKGLKNYYEVADHLDIEEEILIEAIDNYREKYGLMFNAGDYIINFGSSIEIYREDNKHYPYDYGC
ncbi:TPA_asm: hypothetical protein GEV19_03015 [Listeria monocytogenes]|nr:hypothetical protein [Listeria monocytogenes]